ncbi:hypothetical protein QAD02_023980 [Eretmocerus hayati]|uniref:Uncharacterized protein n=1 Tax=Eretmocerus hayati TaxID=131215 RepID=A0ACC2Q297_9HYME|nr:hypothetical protein QAD02_023980 [Eretmocerus hayati]
MDPNDVEEGVTIALESGYTHFDSNYIAGTEKPMGLAFKKYFEKGNKREELYIVARMPLFGNRASDVEEYLKYSLEHLGLDYVDMYMIAEAWGLMRDYSRGGAHDAFVIYENGTFGIDPETDLVAVWKALELQVKKGLTRSIGFANFNETQISKIINNCEIKPSYMLVGEYVYHQEKELRKFCAENDVALSSFTPLGCTPGMETIVMKGYWKLPEPQKNPVIVKIAENHRKTPAQVMLRHQHQNGIINVIPGIAKPEQIKAHIDIYDFELSKDEMDQLDNLDRGEEGRILGDYNFPGVFEHPEYPFPTH